MEKLLFVTHDANRTGAPLFLLNFLQWLRNERPELRLDVLIRRGGSLDSDFLRVADDVFRWESDSALVRLLLATRLMGKRSAAFHRLCRRLSGFEKKLLRTVRGKKYDLVFVNSLANAGLIPGLADHVDCPIVCRAPELASYVGDHIGTDPVAVAIPCVDRFIAVSDLVASYMVDELGIPAAKIAKIPGFFRPQVPTRPRALVRAELGIPDRAFVVCGSGTRDWRKGIDLFLHVAIDLVRRFPHKPVYFCWVGGDGDMDSSPRLKFDREQSGCSVNLLFVPETGSPQDYFAASDVFALTSREDPFPLVALEAASLGLPVICFDAAVGSKEFVNETTGRLVPYPDICAFSDAIVCLYEDQALYRRTSENIKRTSLDFTIDKIGRRLVSFLDTIAEPTTSSLGQ